MAGAAIQALSGSTCLPTSLSLSKKGPQHNAAISAFSPSLAQWSRRRGPASTHFDNSRTEVGRKLVCKLQSAKGILGRQLILEPAFAKTLTHRSRAAQCSLVGTRLVSESLPYLNSCFSYLAFAAFAVACWHSSPTLFSRLQQARNSSLPKAAQGSSNPSELSQGYRQTAKQSALLSSSLLLPATLNPTAVSQFCRTLRANPTFMTAFIAWTLAQVLKVFTTLYKEGRLDVRKLVASGGMPSSHSSLCVALTTSVAIVNGVSGSLFPVALGFSLIVMYDAAGVRLHAGKQAEVLNRMIEDMYEGHPVGEIKLKELLGHTPLQVLGGAAVGLLVGLWYPQSRFAIVK